MRENRTYGSEGGEGISSFRPLSVFDQCRIHPIVMFVVGRPYAADLRFVDGGL